MPRRPPTFIRLTVVSSMLLVLFFPVQLVTALSFQRGKEPKPERQKEAKDLPSLSEVDRHQRVRERKADRVDRAEDTEDQSDDGQNEKRPTPGRLQEPDNLPALTDTAFRQGFVDGKPGGDQEARERGRDLGRASGHQRGFLAGGQRCESDAKEAEYKRGLREGEEQSRPKGYLAGVKAGEDAARIQALRDGTQAGQLRAEQDAYQAAYELGAEEGSRQAESDRQSILVRAESEGKAAGREEARRQADLIEYQKARDAYRQKRMANPPFYRESYSLTDPPRPFTRASLVHAPSVAKVALVQLPPSAMASSPEFCPPPQDPSGISPDYRYANPNPNYATQAENRAYRQGYREGYQQRFQNVFPDVFRSVYLEAFRVAEVEGCNAARVRSYETEYQRGREDGTRVGYQESYQKAYDETYARLVEVIRTGEIEKAYRIAYPQFYQQFLMKGRTDGYRNRTEQLYSQIYNEAKATEFQARYPGFARDATQRGIEDEMNEFVQHPVQLVFAEAIESVPNGLIEPGEPMKLRIQLRNFSTDVISASTITILVQRSDPKNIQLPQPFVVLNQALQPDSLTDISDVMDIIIADTALAVKNSTTGQPASAPVRIEVAATGNKLAGQPVSFELTPQYQMKIELTEVPVFREGISSSLKFRVTNQSSAKPSPVSRFSVKFDDYFVEIPQSDVLLEPLEPGAAAEITLPVLTRRNEANILAALSIGVFNQNGRKLGKAEVVPQLKVVNSYQLLFPGDPLKKLRRAGKESLDVYINNITSPNGQNVELLVRRVEDSAPFLTVTEQAKMIPLIGKSTSKKATVSFEISRDNTGGLLEFELRENGVPVLIRWVEF
ncbi:MAG: hypothetical protein HY774_23890 [Acidobacteria bacterium]|nr:hypothetical protein [Acidobacteriota bacterium]